MIHSKASFAARLAGLVLAVAFGAVALASAGRAFDLHETQEVTASNAGYLDLFGGSVAIDGDTLITGAVREDTRASDAGAAYVFERVGGVWVEIQKLTASDGLASDYFGTAVAIDGDTAMVGAWNHVAGGYRSGAVYVFERIAGSWVETQKLLPGTPGHFYEFGSALAIDGDRVLIGAYGDDHQGSETGSAYVFARSGGSWQQEARLVADDAAGLDRFGERVALNGDRALIGASGADQAGTDSGAAYAFELVGGIWTQSQKLVAGDAADGDSFGSSVALSNTTAIIGAYGRDGHAPNSGVAYAFVEAGGAWTQQARLETGNARSNSLFGNSAAILGDVAVIGARSQNDPGPIGAAYVFHRQGSEWRLALKLRDGNLDITAHGLGVAVALTPDRIVAGADGAGNWQGSATGAVLVYDFDLTDSDGDGIYDPDDVDVDGDGIPDEVEAAAGLDPISAADGPLDLDGDSWSNVDEYRRATVIDDGTSTPAGQLNPHFKTISGDGDGSPGFGSAVLVDAGTALLSDASDVDNGPGSGSAYVFERAGDTWVRKQKLTPYDFRDGDAFGASTAIDGNTIMISANGRDDPHNRAGAVYVFARESGAWSERQILRPAVAVSNETFGTNVAVDADTAFVAAKYGLRTRLYVFERQSDVWVETQTIEPSGSHDYDGFGSSIAIAGDQALVGAFTDDGAGDRAGAVYVFERVAGAWSEVAVLRGLDTSAGGGFGHSVALLPDTALIGAPDSYDTVSGAVYEFTRGPGGWSQTDKITADDGGGFDLFGHSVSASGDRLLVGAPFVDQWGYRAGAVYLLHRSPTGWTQTGRFNVADPAPSATFGSNWRAALDGDDVVLGRYSPPAVYFFDVDLDDDGLTNPLEAALGTIATNPDSDGDGLSDLAEVSWDGDATRHAVGAEPDPNVADTDGDGLLDGEDPDPLVPGGIPLPSRSAPFVVGLIGLLGLVGFASAHRLPALR